MKMTVLLHKTALVNFPMATTVHHWPYAQIHFDNFIKIKDANLGM